MSSFPTGCLAPMPSLGSQTRPLPCTQELLIKTHGSESSEGKGLLGYPKTWSGSYSAHTIQSLSWGTVT